MKLAGSVIIDRYQHTLTIDGVEFPFYLAEPGPQVDGFDIDFPIAKVAIPLLVDGIVEIRMDDGRSEFHDPEHGEVGAWARRLVREGLLERLPWLDLQHVGDPEAFL